MKKQENNNTNSPLLMGETNGTLSRVLLVVAIVVYSVSLVLLANLALAAGSSTKGALVKVNNRLDGNAFGQLQPNVKSHYGNILSVNADELTLQKLQKVGGVCDVRVDGASSTIKSTLDIEATKEKYDGADMVVGILDNSGEMNTLDFSMLKKTEPLSNVGFISYKANANSTVIIRNLVAGESNLAQALVYMHQYAETVSKPLTIELILSGDEFENPLFVQVCQKFAEAGVQFINGGAAVIFPKDNITTQFAFTMFNPKTDQLSDKTDFWALSEVKDHQLMLLGSDNKMCSIKFETEAGFEKVYLSNESDDIVTITSLGKSGDVSYFHIASKETALIPRELQNGTPFLADGLDGIYPFLSKHALFNDKHINSQFVALKKQNMPISLNSKSGMNMSIGSPTGRTLAMSLTELDSDLEIEIKDEVGATVYKKCPEAETKSLHTKINLSEGGDRLYFLDLTSPKYHQSIALMVD